MRLCSLSLHHFIRSLTCIDAVWLPSVLISGQVPLRGGRGAVNGTVCSLNERRCERIPAGIWTGNPASDLHDWIISLEASTRDSTVLVETL
jgi:hypothetical protein